MICISINQESRRLVLVDMLNAAPQCDLIEVRLDSFSKAPDIGELMKHKPSPVIMSCRRTADGGNWQGKEEDRLALLRQCIISQADYVEIELDVADDIRRFPPSQRVITYTNLQETPEDILEIYEEMQSKNPDVIKLVTLARTPEEAWPLVQIMAKQRVPTVVVGLGKPGIMLSILGRKIGAPWTYAALERGMEAYPGQASVHALNEIYRYKEITKSTRLVGVTGFGDREVLTVSVLNHFLSQLKMPVRCLPMGVGSVSLFRKVIKAVKLAGVVVDSANQTVLYDVAGEKHATAQQAQAVDVLVNKDDVWRGYNTFFQAHIQSLVSILKERTGGEEPLKGRVVALVGGGSLTKSIAQEMQRRGANVILASDDKKSGQALAQELDCRYIQFEALYNTMHDVLIVCDQERADTRGNVKEIHPGYLKSGMTVMDLTATMVTSPLLDGAKARGCNIVDPHSVMLSQLALQVRLLTGQDISTATLAEAIPEQFRREDD